MGRNDDENLRGPVWTLDLQYIEIDTGMALLDCLYPLPSGTNQSSHDSIRLEIGWDCWVRAEDDCIDRGGATPPCNARSTAEPACPSARESGRARVRERFLEFVDTDTEVSDIPDWVWVAQDSELQLVEFPLALSRQEFLLPERTEDPIHLLRAKVVLMDSAEDRPSSHYLARMGRMDSVCRPQECKGFHLGWGQWARGRSRNGIYGGAWLRCSGPTVAALSPL